MRIVKMGRRTMGASLLAVAIAGGGATAWAVQVPNPDPCDAQYTPGGTDIQMTNRLRNYMDCRLDRIERAVPPPAPTVTVTGPTTTVPGPTTTVTGPTTTVTGPTTTETKTVTMPALFRMGGGIPNEVIVKFDTGDVNGGSLSVDEWPYSQENFSRVGITYDDGRTNNFSYSSASGANNVISLNGRSGAFKFANINSYTHSISISLKNTTGLSIPLVLSDPFDGR